MKSENSQEINQIDRQKECFNFDQKKWESPKIEEIKIENGSPSRFPPENALYRS